MQTCIECVKLHVVHGRLIILFTIMQYSRLHTGAAEANVAMFISTCMQVVNVFPISSKPKLQLYVAVSPTELPVNVIMPFTMSAGSGHRAAEQE